MPRNLPNLITGARLVLALALFVILAAVAYGRSGDSVSELSRLIASRERLLLNLSLVIFLLAAISDILDGEIARRWNLQTDFGRIVDPFADKVIVCGVFIELVPLEGSQVSAWMVVVILSRELLVDGLRGFAESRGVAFGANMSGKLKMVLQSGAICWILGTMANARGIEWAETFTYGLLMSALAVTVLSGLSYVYQARKVLRSDALATLSGGSK